MKKLFVLLLTISIIAAAYDWQPYPGKAALMLVTAHADDEGIFFGGAIAWYSLEKNLPVIVVCMTHDSVETRADELRCAVWTYGCRYEPLFAELGDCCYGQDLQCCWNCWGGKDKAVDFVTAKIRRFKPDVVLCHDFGGEYGHPNHKGAAIAAAEACLAAKDPGRFSFQLAELDVWDVRKCYVHMLDTNKMTHSWDMTSAALGGKTAREATNEGLLCHASQGPHTHCVNGCGGQYAAWPAENWGLYYTTVGKDSIAKDDFFENINTSGYTSETAMKKPLLLYSLTHAFSGIYNLNGQKVASTAENISMLRLDLMRLPPGTYLYMIRMAGKLKTIKANKF
jgi:LmbE family N-acetylglucosaminyl deacetylase